MRLKLEEKEQRRSPEGSSAASLVGHGSLPFTPWLPTYPPQTSLIRVVPGFVENKLIPLGLKGLATLLVWQLGHYESTLTGSSELGAQLFHEWVLNQGACFQLCVRTELVLNHT